MFRDIVTVFDDFSDLSNIVTQRFQMKNKSLETILDFEDDFLLQKQ